MYFLVKLFGSFTVRTTTTRLLSFLPVSTMNVNIHILYIALFLALFCLSMVILLQYVCKGTCFVFRYDVHLYYCTVVDLMRGYNSCLFLSAMTICSRLIGSATRLACTMLLQNAADASASPSSHLFHAHKGTQLVYSAPNSRYNGALAILPSDLGTTVFLKRCLKQRRVTLSPRGTVNLTSER